MKITSKERKKYRIRNKLKKVSKNKESPYADNGYIRPIIITSKPTKQLNGIWLALGEDTATHNTQDASR